MTYLIHHLNISSIFYVHIYTAKNSTGSLQIVNFTGLLQVVNKLQQACQFYQIATSLLRSGLLQ